jgi:DNA-binding transcriptional LysR family regulator
MGNAMTLDQLRIFVAVAERQHMTQAARALNLAQSAVSHAIAALEARHQTRLFDRVGRRIELTEAGVVLLAEAQRILAQVDAVDLALGDFGALKRGRLSVQASQTIAGYWLPRHLVAFHESHPNVTVRLKIGNTAEVAAAVLDGSVELGFVEGAVSTDRLVCLPVARDQLVIVVGPAHPWAAGKKLSPSDLLRGVWVLREPGSGTRSAFEEALAHHDIAPGQLQVAMELPSNEAVRAAVEAGLGATALSASVAASGVEAGLLHAANFLLPDRAFYLLRHPSHYETRAASALVDMVAPRSAPFASRREAALIETSHPLRKGKGAMTKHSLAKKKLNTHRQKPVG